MRHFMTGGSNNSTNLQDMGGLNLNLPYHIHFFTKTTKLIFRMLEMLSCTFFYICPHIFCKIPFVFRQQTFWRRAHERRDTNNSVYERGLVMPRSVDGAM
jgi:hypothetical protein